MSDESTGSRLPPPAFPPGSRKHVTTNGAPGASGDLGDGFISPDEPMPERQDQVGEAFISPDEPLPDRGAVPTEGTMGEIADEAAGDAFISPDEPIPHRDPVAGGLPEFDTEGGVVTSMGMDEHMDPEELVAGGDPYVMDLVQKVGKLAEALKAKGEAGLRSSPDMDKFETTLRGYCVGYLAGRRAQDDQSGADF